MLGEAMVGKTTLVTAFMGVDEIAEGYRATLGTDLSRKTVQINGEEVLFQIWDLSGQQAFRSIRSNFLKGAKGAIIVYDISSRRSFSKINDWLQEVISIVGKIPVVLVGNKLDLREGIHITGRKQKQEKIPQYLTQTFSILQEMKEGTAKDIANKTGRKVVSESIYLSQLLKRKYITRERQQGIFKYRIISQPIQVKEQKPPTEFISTDEGYRQAETISQITGFYTHFVEAAALYRTNSEAPFIRLGRVIISSIS